MSEYNSNSKKIMVVDDVDMMQNILYHLLVKLDHDVVCQAKDGLEAVEMYKKFNPDLVMMDIMMPNMDGLNAIKHIKELDESAKIIVVSALSSNDLITRAKNAGAIDYLIKPYSFAQVKEMIEKYMQN